MSSRARRIQGAHGVERFGWGGAIDPDPESYGVDAPSPALPAVDLAALERDAFTKGYAQGERAGAEAGAARAEAMLRRLAQTLDDLQGLRKELLRRTEREVAELALAIARRVVHRELALDQDLLLAMARVALDRLGDVAAASIRLHPDDYAAVMASRSAMPSAPQGVQIVADPSVHRGGCVVQSEFGSVDVGVTTQIDELTHTLLGDTAPGPRPIGLRDDAAA
ncbi:MAG: FliH/SctL family protein [Candidatus Binatia bacterium]